MARQNSISNNCFTAVIIRTQGTGALAAYALIQTSWEDANGKFADWAELTPWKYLPNGIIFEKTEGNADTYMQASASLPSSLPSTVKKLARFLT